MKGVPKQGQSKNKNYELQRKDMLQVFFGVCANGKAFSCQT